MHFRKPVSHLHLNPLHARLVPDLPPTRTGIPGAGTRVFCIPRSTGGRRALPASRGTGAPGEPPLRATRTSLRAGIPHGHRPKLVGGGLIRSLSGRAEVRAVRVLPDARILGSGEVVA